MSRYLGPVCRLCRRENEKLYLKGERCYSEKCAIERRTSAGRPTGRASKASEYKIRLREKQKIKRSYGLLEKQFHSYFVRAESSKGVTGHNLLANLESRLDNVVYRAGFCTSRREARQLVRHGHFLINGHRVSFPGARVNSGDTVEVRQSSKQIERIKTAVQLVGHRGVPKWLALDASALTAKAVATPARADVTQPFNEQLVVELYSR